MNSGKQLDCEDLSHEEKANSPFGVIGFVESLEEEGRAEKPMPLFKCILCGLGFHRWSHWKLEEKGGPFAQFTDPQFFQRRICVRCNLSKTKKY